MTSVWERERERGRERVSPGRDRARFDLQNLLGMEIRKGRSQSRGKLVVKEDEAR
jgi:hypothetical protein